MNNKPSSPKKGRINTTTTRPITTTKGRSPQKEVHPADIHELRMKTLQNQNQIKLLKTQRSRLKDKISLKNEAIDSTSKPNKIKTNSTSKSRVAQLHRSFESARNTLSNLQEEIGEAEIDDRTAFYQEMEEEIKISYCEYDRIQNEIQYEKGNTKDCRERFKEIDNRASKNYASQLSTIIKRNKDTNNSLRDKWNAYQQKVRKLEIEKQIIQNRKNKVDPKDTIEQAKESEEKLQDEIHDLNKKLEKEDRKFRENVDYLMNIINNQRQRIIEHLLGKDQEEPKDEEENQVEE